MLVEGGGHRDLPALIAMKKTLFLLAKRSPGNSKRTVL
jgi:hypothetical protein